MTDTYTQILRQQREWAAKRNIAADNSGYTDKLSDNLFQPANPETLLDFRSGSGDELGGKGRRGKMHALHSSSALAVNVFDYWRDRSRAWITNALSLTSEPMSLCFERKFPTGLRGTPPNLDVTFKLADGRTVAVESKFTETYVHANHVAPFKDKYFPIGNGLWHGRALPRCQEIVRQLRQCERQFRYLNAAQLLKHALGLAQPNVGPFTLIYIWYDAPSEEAVQHGKEVKEFADAITPELDFRALKYQDLFSFARKNLEMDHVSYLNYLEERYFRR